MINDLGLTSSSEFQRSEYIITKHALGNEKIKFYVEMACSGMFGVGDWVNKCLCFDVLTRIESISVFFSTISFFHNFETRVAWDPLLLLRTNNTL